MKFVRNLIRRISTRRTGADIDWFNVTYDNGKIYMYANPPRSDPWHQEFIWNDIERICYKVEEFPVTDGIYIFTSKRPESYVIPIEAIGGHDFWLEIIRRNLFDEKLAIQVASSVEGIYCWPSVESDNGS